MTTETVDLVRVKILYWNCAPESKISKRWYERVTGQQFMWNLCKKEWLGIEVGGHAMLYYINSFDIATWTHQTHNWRWGGLCY